MDIVAQEKKTKKRYLPHTLATRVGAVNLYRYTHDIDFVLRRYHISKAPSSARTNNLAARGNPCSTNPIAHTEEELKWIRDHYAQKIKISNLQQMAKTIAYVQEHEYGTRENLQESFEEVTAKMHDARKELRDTERQLKALNEKIHYTGQYLANKAVYGQMLKARNKKKFRQEHSSEISLYESAVKYLKSQYSDSRFPTMKVLKEERDRLTVQKQAQTDTWHYFRDYQKELRTVCSNVDSILGQSKAREPEHTKSKDIS